MMPVIDHNSDSQELRLGGSNMTGTEGTIEDALIDLLRLTLLHLHDFEIEEPGTLMTNIALLTGLRWEFHHTH